MFNKNFKYKEVFENTGWGLLIVLCFGVLAMLSFYSSRADDITKINDGVGGDYCPVGNEVQKEKGYVHDKDAVILIDTSNRISEKDGEYALKEIEGWIRGLAPFTKIFVVGLPKNKHDEYEILVPGYCVVWDKNTAQDISWAKSVIYAEKNYQEGFLATVKVQITTALNLGEADQSPILETFSILSKNTLAVSVFVVSDMLQNTDMETHYGKGRFCDDCLPIKNLGFTIYYINRENVRYPNNHKGIWNRYLSKVRWIDGYNNKEAI